ncbi:retrovirus-related pol polyprotein from transposon TNT 1-94 [Tanacetum coccineum]
MRSLQDLYESTNEMHFVCLLADSESIKFEEAIRDKKWKNAMDEEIASIERNKTWELVELPKGHQLIGVKWNGDDKAAHFSSGTNEVANLLNGCEICVFEWCARGRSCPYEHALYVKQDGNKLLFVALYVDHIIFMGNDEKMVMEFKEAMTKEFEMTDLGLMKYFLGLEIRQCKSRIFVSQERHVKDILKKSKMEECNPVATPMEPGTKLSKFEGGDRVDAAEYRSVDPKYSHWKAVKRILRYLKGTESLGLFYSSSTKYRLLEYSDSDWHGDVDDLKSTSGYAFYFGDTAFTWASKNQPIVTLSTCEAEYVAASWCMCHAIWLKNLLSELQSQQHEATEIRIDNKSAIELARNPVHHERSKHIDVRFHFIREQIRNGEVQLIHVASRDQVADIFTKALPTELFNYFKMKLGIKDGVTPPKLVAAEMMFRGHYFIIPLHKS